MSSVVDPSHSRRYSLAEERANAVTHGVAAALAVAAMITLVALAVASRDVARILTVTVFGGSLVLLYVASTCYHACADGPRKRSLRVLDHAAIFVLIAGSYTPFLVVLMRGPWSWALLAALWGIAGYGVISKLRDVAAAPIRSTVLYLLMGWIGVLAAKPLFGSMPAACVAWIVAGGLSYTLGVTFYAWRRLPYHHAVWHLFVAAGSACHVVAVMGYVIPVPA